MLKTWDYDYGGWLVAWNKGIEFRSGVYKNIESELGFATITKRRMKKCNI